MYEKENIDARTFPQIWNSLTATEQAELRDRLMRTGDISRTALFNWSKGKTSPASIGNKRRVAAAINKFLGYNVSHLTLFPTHHGC